MVPSTTIDAENIICIEDKPIWSRQARQQREDSLSPPPPPQTAPDTEAPENDEKTTECPPSLPEDLHVNKEFIQHDKDDNYIPLMSAIALKKKKRMLFLPVEFKNVKIDALVDLGAYMNAISEGDAEKIQKMQANASSIKHHHPFQRTVRNRRTRTITCNVHSTVQNWGLHF